LLDAPMLGRPHAAGRRNQISEQAKEFGITEAVVIKT
jgi:hypothetical protein